LRRHHSGTGRGRARAAALLLLLVLGGGACTAARGSDALEAEVAGLIEGWRRAWESADIDRYIGYYHPTFHTRGMGLAAYRNYKATVFQRSGAISVAVTGLAVYTDEGLVIAEFGQHYRSEIHEDHGTKTLVLRRTASGLKITAERWVGLAPPPAPPPPPLPGPDVEPMVSRDLDEGLPPGRVPEPRPEPALPAYEPEVAESPGEVWTAETPRRPPVPVWEPRSKEPVIVEEIVAKVNREIITKTDLQDREREMLEEIYATEMGPAERAESVRQARANVLEDMVSELLLLERAEDLGVDIEGYVDKYVADVKAENDFEDDREFEVWLEENDWTLREFREGIRRRRLPQRLVWEEVTSRIEVTDDEAREFYEAHPELYGELERVHLREIVLLSDDPGGERTARSLCGNVLQRLRAGEDFAQLAMRVGETPSKVAGGDIGTFRRGEMSPELEAVAFSLAAGEISDCVYTEHGYHILQALEVLPARIAPYEEVETQVRQQVLDEKWEGKLGEYLDDLYRTNMVYVNERYRQDAVHSTARPHEEFVQP
jgi:parvulin-like peptidyl-prolyl isomerase